jgi:hypothetical protein
MTSFESGKIRNKTQLAVNRLLKHFIADPQAQPLVRCELVLIH